MAPSYRATRRNDRTRAFLSRLPAAVTALFLAAVLTPTAIISTPVPVSAQGSQVVVPADCCVPGEPCRGNCPGVCACP